MPDANLVAAALGVVSLTFLGLALRVRRGRAAALRVAAAAPGALPPSGDDENEEVAPPARSSTDAKLDRLLAEVATLRVSIEQIARRSPRPDHAPATSMVGVSPLEVALACVKQGLDAHVCAAQSGLDADTIHLLIAIHGPGRRVASVSTAEVSTFPDSPTTVVVPRQRNQ